MFLNGTPTNDDDRNNYKISIEVDSRCLFFSLNIYKFLYQNANFDEKLLFYLWSGFVTYKTNYVRINASVKNEMYSRGWIVHVLFISLLTYILSVAIFISLVFEFIQPTNFMHSSPHLHVMFCWFSISSFIRSFQH